MNRAQSFQATTAPQPSLGIDIPTGNSPISMEQAEHRNWLVTAGVRESLRTERERKETGDGERTLLNTDDVTVDVTSTVTTDDGVGKDDHDSGRGSDVTSVQTKTEEFHAWDLPRATRTPTPASCCKGITGRLLRAMKVWTYLVIVTGVMGGAVCSQGVLITVASELGNNTALGPAGRRDADYNKGALLSALYVPVVVRLLICLWWVTLGARDLPALGTALKAQVQTSVVILTLSHSSRYGALLHILAFTPLRHHSRQQREDIERQRVLEALHPDPDYDDPEPQPHPMHGRGQPAGNAASLGVDGLAGKEESLEAMTRQGRSAGKRVAPQDGGIQQAGAAPRRYRKREENSRNFGALPWPGVQEKTRGSVRDFSLQHTAISPESALPVLIS
ncbi:hypothetical protein ACOMHN_048528 [Nucella lapillus]